jgi:hypothetical protein
VQQLSPKNYISSFSPISLVTPLNATKGERGKKEVISCTYCLVAKMKPKKKVTNCKIVVFPAVVKCVI